MQNAGGGTWGGGGSSGSPAQQGSIASALVGDLRVWVQSWTHCGF